MTSTQRIIRSSAVLLLVLLALSIPAAPLFSQITESGTAQDVPAVQTVTKIGIIGGHDLNRKLVLNRFGVQTGDVFDVDECERGIERVEKLSGVENAFLRILADREGGGVHLVIVISGADTRIMRPTISRCLTNDWSFGFRFEESNFRGMDEKVKSLLLLGGATVAKASWLKPFIMENPRFGGGLSAAYEQCDYPYPDYRRLLVDNNIKRFRASADIRLNITDFAHLTLRPGVDVIETADTISYDERVPHSPNGTFTTLEFILSADLRDRHFYPSGGFILEGGRKDWGVLQSESEMKNFLYWAEGAGYMKLWRLIGVLHSRAVLTHGDVPLLLLQHLGGEGTIRGYEFGVLSGENSLIATAEARFPINFDDPRASDNPLMLADFHLFVNSGSCWMGTDGFDTDLLHSGFGCGVNLMPGERGLISVDYAWQIETNGMWQVNAGFYF
jgi:outer membrane protein assembly factor BamA